MSFVIGLKCRECGREYAKQPLAGCEDCFAPLEVDYDYEGISRVLSREAIATRAKKSHDNVGGISALLLSRSKILWAFAHSRDGFSSTVIAAAGRRPPALVATPGSATEAYEAAYLRYRQLYLPIAAALSG